MAISALASVPVYTYDVTCSYHMCDTFVCIHGWHVSYSSVHTCDMSRIHLCMHTCDMSLAYMCNMTHACRLCDPFVWIYVWHTSHPFCMHVWYASGINVWHDSFMSLHNVREMMVFIGNPRGHNVIPIHMWHDSFMSRCDFISILTWHDWRIVHLNIHMYLYTHTDVTRTHTHTHKHTHTHTHIRTRRVHAYTHTYTRTQYTHTHIERSKNKEEEEEEEMNQSSFTCMSHAYVTYVTYEQVMDYIWGGYD